MKRIIYLSIAFFALLACQKEDGGQQKEYNETIPQELYATIDDETPDTKIHLGEYEGKYRVLWDGWSDATAVFAGVDQSTRYRVKGATANTPDATLYVEKDGDYATGGNPIGHIVAYYPNPNNAAGNALQVTDNGDGSYTIPGAFSGWQTYREGSFPDRGFPLAAVSTGTDDYTLNFKNVAGGLGIHVKGGARVTKVTLKSNEDKVICGSADITVSNTEVDGSVPAYVFTGESKTLVLDCDDNGYVATAKDEATPFYMGVAPQVFPEGFTVTISDADGLSRTITTANEQEVKRSRILNMPAVTFPFYETSDWTTFNKGANTEYDAQTKTFTFAADQNSGRWFDLPSFINTDGGFAQHPTLKMWATSSNIVLTVILLHGNYTFDASDGDGNGKETIVATLYGQTDKLVESVRTNLVTLNLYSKLCEKFTTEEATGLLKNVTGIRIKMHASATNAVAPYQVTFDRIVLE